MSDLASRQQRAAETILTNEHLTNGLDDPVAQALVDWGVALAEHVARSTQDLAGVQAATELETRLPAVRRLMRRVRSWLVKRAELDDQTVDEILSDVFDQAAIIYRGFQRPDPVQHAHGVEEWRTYAERPRELIDRLRSMVEDPGVQAAPQAQPSSRAIVPQHFWDAPTGTQVNVGEDDDAQTD
jgi:hypothetical protein